MYVGMRSVGMHAVLTTRVCKDCDEVVSVLIGFCGQDGPCGHAEHDKDLNVCPICHGTNLKHWSTHRTCPKCKGKMREDPESFICWD